MAVKKPNKLTLHWTAGANKPSTIDVKHYHAIVYQKDDGSAAVHFGDKNPEANNDCSDGNYAAHCRANNTGNIGVGIAGMHEASQKAMGPYPINKAQIERAVEQVAEYLEIYKIPLSRKTVTLHSEVEEVHGIKQRGKWDVNWMWDEKMNAFRLMPAREAGDIFRSMVRDHQDALAEYDGFARKKRPGKVVLDQGLFPAAGHFLSELISEIMRQMK